MKTGKGVSIVTGAGHGHAFFMASMDVTRSEYKHVFAHHTPFTFGFHVSKFYATGSTLKQKDSNAREDHVKEVEVGLKNTWRQLHLIKFLNLFGILWLQILLPYQSTAVRLTTFFIIASYRVTFFYRIQ